MSNIWSRFAAAGLGAVMVFLAGCAAIEFAGTMTRKTGEAMTEYSKANDGVIAGMAGLGGRVNTAVGSTVEGIAKPSTEPSSDKASPESLASAQATVIAAAVAASKETGSPGRPPSVAVEKDGLAPKGRMTSLDGKWTAKFVATTGRQSGAAMVIRGNEGTWKSHVAPPGNPCLGSETPVAVEQTTKDSFLIKILYSKLLANCIDGSFSARLENGILKGQFGNGRALELNREQEAQGQVSLIGSWLVTVAGDPKTRTLIVSEEAPTPSGALLGVIYGMTHLGQSPISAKVLRVGDQRQLVLVTQAGATIAATEQSDGTFKGTFTYRNGVVKEVSIVRISDVGLQ